MNCYFIRHNKQEPSKKEGYKSYIPLTIDEKEKIQLAAKELQHQIKGKNVFFIYENDFASFETAMTAKQVLGISNDKFAADDRLNSRKTKDNDMFCEKVEKYDEYSNRIFEIVTEMIMTHSDEDVVVFVGGEHLFKTCQKDDNLHTLMYFGDEVFITPLEAGACASLRGYINNEISQLVAYSFLSSKKEQQPFKFEKVILEVPKVHKNGYVEPVYLKYAKKKANKSVIDKSKQTGQMGE